MTSKYVRKTDRTYRRPTGRPPKHGHYAIARREDRGQIGRLYDVEQSYIRDLGHEQLADLTTGQRVALSRLCAKLAALEQIEGYLSRFGLLRRDRLDQKVLEAEPIVAVWLALNTQVENSLKILGLERRPAKADVDPDIITILRQQEKKGPELAQERAQDAPAATNPAPEGDSLGGGESEKEEVET